MAKYKAYPEYKDSGVESLDTIPKMWSIKKLKYIFEIKKRIAGKIGFDVLSVTQKGIKIKDIESGEGQLSMDYSKYQRVYPGEFAMNHMDLLTGYVDISNYDGVTSPDYRVFAVRDKHSFYSRYYLYLLQDGYKQRRFFHLGQGSAHLGRWRLPTEAFNEIVYPCPSLTEQIHIASFLDHETAKIDNLIEKQQQLIELLKEKRQAVISHAVTKGLNPDVPMKDSGVEWLGEVPDHWTISTLKHHAKFIDGDRGSEYPNDNDLVDDGVVFLSSKNISNWEINIDDANYISREKFNRLNRGKTINGDVIVKVRGSTGRIGELAIFETERLNKSTAFINAQMMIIRLKNSFNNRFLCNVAQGHYWMEQLNVGAYGTAQQQLNNAIFSGMIMVVPPIDEQLTINKFLELEIKRFDGLIKNTSNMIQLIQERRTALISAAVTGKIDVRDWVAPDMQDIEEPQEATV
ncbi:restriction endonuclease subunit S [Citrobacter freundii]|nr:restriction endonuclease subunit S [Citrobacter freundii]MBC6506114.1 restriction endonuclease subunit S [Citrobacter freundii]